MRYPKWKLIVPRHSPTTFVSKDIHYEPWDLFYNRKNAAQVVFDWAMQRERSSYERTKARWFLKQWPEGPQLPLRFQGSPMRGEVTTVMLSIEKDIKDQIPGSYSAFIREAIKEKLKRINR